MLSAGKPVAGFVCRFVFVLLVVCLPLTSRSQTPAPPPDPQVTEIEPLTVTGLGGPWLGGPLPWSFLQQGAGENLAEALENLAGVWALRQAASGAEPVIRGLGAERVQTVLGAVPLYGACPGRMDPPATYLGGVGTQAVSLFRQGGGWGLGPGGTGGAIVASPDYRRPAHQAPGLTPFAEAGYRSARESYHARAGIFGGTEKLDLSFGLEKKEAEDYEAPDGTTVPARAQSRAAAASLGVRLDPDTRLWGAVNYMREEDVDFPSLPMDNLETDFWVANAGLSRSYPGGGTLRRLELTGGFSTIDHFMGNAYKVSRALQDATTDADTRTQAVHLVGDLAPGHGLELTTGLDFNRLGRDATRTRIILASGDTYLDRLWPDAVQATVGGHAHLRQSLNPTLHLEIGGRVDLTDSKARAADEPSLGGLSVREQYVRFNGAEAADTDRSETLAAVDLSLEKTWAAGSRAFLRTALSSRAAGVTERYYAFGPAPGGYLIGNPTLAAEKKLEAETGLRLGEGPLVAQANLFYARVGDYILPSVVLRGDVNGDGISDTVKGFTNVDARLYGGELGVEFRPSGRLRLPVTLAYVRGRNTSEDRDLPEIPSLTLTAEAQLLACPRTSTWLTFGALAASDQEKIDPLFPENRTPGHTVFHVALDTRPVAGLRVRLGVENLFDRLYHDHLTRPALLPAGDLAAGQEIPAPGRDVRLSARWQF